MKTKILRISVVLSITLAYNACNPSVPSASGSQIGIFGEVFRSSRANTSTATTTGAGTSTNNGVAVTYANAAYIFTIKIAATSITPIITQGTPTSYSISPSLPTGLNFDTTTGVISGTPASILIPTNHTLTATGANNTSGTYTFKLTIYGTPLTKTAQTACYNTAGGVISCTGTGQDGEIRAGINASFTGPTTNPGYAGDILTYDNNTGLVWATCTYGLSGSTCGTGTATTTTWAAATSFCSGLNTTNSGNGYGGIKNWKLPSMKEQFSLINFGNANPAIYTSNFPNNFAANCCTSPTYWSSDSDSANSANAWSANYGGISVDIGISTQGSTPKTNNNHFFRCVSGSISSNTFVDNGDQTILDVSTGLTWTKCLLGKSGSDCSQGTANAYTWTTLFSTTSCSGLSLAGKTWRVPNAKEIGSIADYSFNNPAHNSIYFPGDYYFSMSSTSRPTMLNSSEVFWGSNGSFYGSWTGTPQFYKTDSGPTRCVTGP